MSASSVSCGIVATEKLDSQFVKSPAINQIMSVVGWGEENDTGYWIEHNSWGEP